VAALVDTNVLVYRFDPRFPQKQRVATTLLRRGIADDSIRVPHQALIEFVAATTRPISREPRNPRNPQDPGRSLLTPADARREAEEMLSQYAILYPDEAVFRLAVRGAAAYQLGWFDAHVWAFAERFALDTLYSEDFQHGRLYGSVRTINPFIEAAPA
jgi:predicted nucleic acid-binding protein